MGGNKSFSRKKKAVRLVPKILTKSKVISKGKGYNEKINRRKIDNAGGASTGQGRAHGANNLHSKKINEKRFLRKVPGMAMTKAEKKKMEKKKKRLLSQSMC
jgi:hypothetical protein